MVGGFQPHVSVNLSLKILIDKQPVILCKVCKVHLMFPVSFTMHSCSLCMALAVTETMQRAPG